MTGPPGLPPVGGPQLKSETIDDFRVGIVSQTNFANAGTYPAPASALPKGAAQELDTYGCMALPGGGLGPLPGPVKTIAGPTGLAGAWAVNGAFVIPQVNGNDEIVFGLEQLSGGNREFYLESYQTWDNTLTNMRHYGPEPNTAGDGTASITGGMTRVNTSTPANPGNPCLAMAYEWLGTTTGPTAHNWLYPDPSAPGTTFVPFEISSPQNGQAVCFDNRILILTVDNYGWTSGSTNLDTNEQINFTDPPNSDVMGSQNSVLVQENPFGYGAWGSIAAGELVLIKQQGGGVLVSGDIVSPTVTRLPGMPGTDGMLGIGASTPIGFVYGSAYNGVWVWNGGNTAEKLSQNLSDNFFIVGTNGGIGFSFCCQGQFIFCSNDWVYDIVTGGWWRLTDVPRGAAIPDLWMLPAGDGSGVWALPASVSYGGGTPTVATKYSRSAPMNAYSWKSYPLAVTKDRPIAVREVVVRAQGDGTITITVEGVNGSTATSVPGDEVINSTQPVLYRFAIGGATGHDLTVKIQSVGAGGGAAPIVLSITLFYEELTPGLNAT